MRWLLISLSATVGSIRSACAASTTLTRPEKNLLFLSVLPSSLSPV
jgi:hypothetical protein